MEIPQETIILILMFPVVATVIAFLRQVIGIKAFGIYTPLIITFAFLATGLKYGLIIFLLVLVAGTLARLAIRRLRLLYLPRMAIVLTIVAAIIFAFFWVGGEELNAISIFPILIIMTLVEKFVAAQIDKGFNTAVVLSTETLALSIVAYFVASWTWLQALLLHQPAWILLTLVINFALGRWTGLRLIEYFKYREVLRHVEMDKK